MTTQSSAVSESATDTPAAEAVALSATRPLYWSVRRELWEHRAIIVAPLVAAGVVLFGFAISALFTLASKVGKLAAAEPAAQTAALAVPYGIGASLIVLTAYIVGALYSLEALHGDRRDRSILFWKSLPVSDLTTVLAKASIPLVVLPLIAYTAGLVTQLAMLFGSTAILIASGTGAGMLWSRLPLAEMSLVMVYGLTVHALWHAPIYAWFLLLSGWARRTPLLWAVMPPLGLIAIEKIVLQTSHVASLLKYRLGGAMVEAFALTGSGGHAPLRITHVDPLRFLASPGLWVGLVVAAFFLATAVRLRRRGEPL